MYNNFSALVNLIAEDLDFWSGGPDFVVGNLDGFSNPLNVVYYTHFKIFFSSRTPLIIQEALSFQITAYLAPC